MICIITYHYTCSRLYLKIDKIQVINRGKFLIMQKPRKDHLQILKTFEKFKIMTTQLKIKMRHLRSCLDNMSLENPFGWQIVKHNGIWQLYKEAIDDPNRNMKIKSYFGR